MTSWILGVNFFLLVADMQWNCILPLTIYPIQGKFVFIPLISLSLCELWYLKRVVPSSALWKWRGSVCVCVPVSVF